LIAYILSNTWVLFCFSWVFSSLYIFINFFLAQEAAIQSVTMSRIICDNTDDVDQIQVDAFLVESG